MDPRAAGLQLALPMVLRADRVQISHPDVISAPVEGPASVVLQEEGLAHPRVDRDLVDPVEVVLVAVGREASSVPIATDSITQPSLARSCHPVASWRRSPLLRPDPQCKDLRRRTDRPVAAAGVAVSTTPSGSQLPDWQHPF